MSKMVIGGRFISESVELDLVKGGASFVGGGLTILREAAFPKIFVKGWWGFSFRSAAFCFSGDGDVPQDGWGNTTFFEPNSNAWDTPEAGEGNASLRTPVYLW